MPLAVQNNPAEQDRPELSGEGEKSLAPEAASPADEAHFLARLLIEQNSVPGPAIERAMQAARESGERLEAVLTRLGLISENALTELLAHALDLPLVSAKDFPDEPVLEGMLSWRFLKEACLIPLKDHGDGVAVAMVHPLDAYALAAVRFACGKRAMRAVAYLADFEAAYTRLYGELSAGETALVEHRASDEPFLSLRRWVSHAKRAYAIAVSLIPGARAALGQSPKPVRRVVSLSLVAAIHLVALWLLADAMLPPAKAPVREIGMALSSSSLPSPRPAETLPPPELAEPALVEIPAPQIEIAPAKESNAMALAVGGTQLIAPRPDPAHPNDPPANDTLSGAARCTGEVVLRVLVEADGTIGDAAVAKSCGAAERDRMALAYAKEHWRYLPATLAGQPVQDWTTVIVPLR